MALFKSRRGAGDESAPPPAAATESVEAVRRRARHRLIGAVVLVLAGVIGFPLLFDTQPRPVAVDIPIEIPDRNKVKPLTPPPAASGAPVAAGRPAPPAVVAAPAATPAPAPASPAVAVAPTPAPAPAFVPAPAPKTEEKPAPKVATAPAPKPAEKPEPRPQKAEKADKPDKAEAKAPAKPASDEGEKARALLEGRTVEAAAPAPAAAGAGRFVVQVGAFSDPDKAREARMKVERAGLRTYTNVAETKDGKRIRVRTGPYASRAEADRAAEKIKGLDLPAAILSL